MADKAVSLAGLAQEYHTSRGWFLTPLMPKKKKPLHAAWQDERIGPADMPKHFTTGRNIGLILGEASRGIADVDLDTAQAIACADLLLPATGLTFGRKSKGCTHRLYRCPGVKSRKWKDPTAPDDKGSIIELRSSGMQTMIPPSMHPDGEPVEWLTNGEPATVDPGVLQTAIRKVAAAAMLAAHWPGPGGRQDAAMHLTGALAHAGWELPDIERFLQAVLDAAGDDEPESRMKCAGYAIKKMAKGEPVTGWPSLAEALADGKRIIDKVVDWLDIKAPATEFGPAQDAPSGESAWQARLERDAKGRIVATRPNLVRILENDPQLKGVFGYNLFTLRPSLIRPVFWNQTPAPWQDNDDAALRCYIEGTYHISSREKLDDALVSVMVKHQFHPVCRYLDGLTWDGTPRLDRLLVDVMGAPDTEYTRAVTRKWFTGAVARVRKPGCKMDYMIVLKGQQGIGKSQFLALMAVQDSGWFSDTPVPFQDAKAVTEVTSGKWVVEMGEMFGLRKTEQEAVKRCISSQGENVRKAFGHYPGNYPRQCVFAGTTNRDDYIPDPTGGRRYWPVDVDPARITRKRNEYLTPEIVGQIWAEADRFHSAGELLYLSEELEAVAYERQLEHTSLDERGAQVREYLDRLLPDDWYTLSLQDRILWLSSTQHSDNPGKVRRDKVCAMEIWVECFGRRDSDLERRRSQEITDIMMQFKDWYRCPDTMRIPGYGIPRCFVRKGVTL
jgi:predicted P-loop ATPase